MSTGQPIPIIHCTLIVLHTNPNGEDEENKQKKPPRMATQNNDAKAVKFHEIFEKTCTRITDSTIITEQKTN